MTDPYTVDMLIDVELPEDNGVQVALDAPQNMDYRYCVSYLPPLKFHIVLGPTYPSLNGPARIDIVAAWLSEEYVKRIKQCLQQQWDEVYTGGPVIYAWIEWLRHEMLSILLTDGATLLLRGQPSVIASSEEGNQSLEGHVQSNGPVSAQLCQRHWQQALLELYVYDRAKKQEEFQRTEHTCYICFEDKFGVDFAQLSCGHTWCLTCLGTMSQNHVCEGLLQLLTCPEPKCSEELHPALLKTLLSPTLYERWERIMLNRTFDAMEDLHYCPRCQTPTLLEGDRLGQCPKCHYAFCALCRLSYHAGECSYEGLNFCNMELERLNAGPKGSQIQQRIDKLKRQAEEMLSRKRVQADSKQCPNCKMPIYKIGGCNKVVCTCCGAKFCYRCGKDVSEEGYRHFAELTGCQGRLFEEQVQGGREADDGPGQENRDIQAEIVRMMQRPGQGPPGGGVELVRCSACGAGNLKLSGNNHIRCVACQQQFCASCRKTFRKPSHHFGNASGKCRQHTI